MSSITGIFKGLQEVLTTPVTLTGRPLSADELRRKRAAKARRRLKGILNPTETLEQRAIQFTIQGRIEAGSQTPFAISGNDFAIDDGTWMLGKVSLGATVTVKGVVELDGKRVARSIVVTKTA